MREEKAAARKYFGNPRTLQTDSEHPETDSGNLGTDSGNPESDSGNPPTGSGTADCLQRSGTSTGHSRRSPRPDCWP